jgi:hypothetical protein
VLETVKRNVSGMGTLAPHHRLTVAERELIAELVTEAGLSVELVKQGREFAIVPTQAAA